MWKLRLFRGDLVISHGGGARPGLWEELRDSAWG